MAGGVDTLRRIYEVFAAGDVEAAARMLDPDIDWDTSAAITGVHVTGIEEAMRDYRGMLEAWKEYDSVTEDFIAAGDHVVVVVRNRGRGAAGGVPIEARRAHVWRFRDGVPVAMRLFLDPDEALTSVGAAPRT